MDQDKIKQPPPTTTTVPSTTSTSTSTINPPSSSNNPPYRQIRATHDSTSITVYQAYNRAIASAAVQQQRLDASPLFRARMTWVKPSWAWMMYRAGYSFKDANQARILAIRVSREGFLEMLSRGELTTHGPGGGNRGGNRNRDGDGDGERKDGAGKARESGEGARVKIQWDPERDFKLNRLGWRSIQIGIPADLVPKWIDEWIVEIKDVTDVARKLKSAIDQNKNIKLEEVVEQGLVHEEKVFEVPEDIYQLLRMDYQGDDQ